MCPLVHQGVYQNQSRCDQTPPGCATLGSFLEDMAGEDDRYAGASDDELQGVICGWERDEANACARKHAAIAELMSLHNLLARSSNNINQLARQANATSEFPAEAREALKHIRSVAMRIDRTIEGLMQG